MIPINISNMSIEQYPAQELQKFYAEAEAKRAFTREHLKSVVYKIGGILTGRSSRVCRLYQEKDVKSIRTRHYEGIRTVPIERICGSESRKADFDNRFHPLRYHTKLRWVSIATEMLMGRILPPVELIKLGDTYFVRDGHHRISAARALGQQQIEADVTTWTIDPQSEQRDENYNR